MLALGMALPACASRKREGPHPAGLVNERIIALDARGDACCRAGTIAGDPPERQLPNRRLGSVCQRLWQMAGSLSPGRPGSGDGPTRKLALLARSGEEHLPDRQLDVVNGARIQLRGRQVYFGDS